MALNITQQPATEDVSNRRLMFACTSDNSANIGFKFRLIVTTTQGTNSFWIPPNPSGAAILDIAQLIKLNNQEVYSSASVHKLLVPTQETSGQGAIYSYTISMQEAWEVDGVLTLQGSATVNTYNMVWNGCLQASDPQSTPLGSRYLLDNGFKRFASDLLPETYPWLYANLHNFAPSSQRVFIPVREEDFGVLTIPYLTTKSVAKIRLTVYEDDGTPHITDIDVTTHPQGTLWNYPLFPGNLNAQSLGWVKPSDYPNWPFITIQALNSSDAARSVTYIMYNVRDKVPVECLFDNRRLAWKGFGGGWEYFNFTKKSTKEYTIERKQYRKVLGDYTTAYVMNGEMRGLTETDIVAEQFIVANSNWVTEGEFEYLRGLFVSRQVMLVDDRGVSTPVVVEDAGFAERKDRDGKMINQTIRIKFSNNLWI